ncbi:zinc finger protein 91-like isoform X2 [Notolabrus celidotus]|nr:zinc finger protein 91-like isoform X2 [Notolabrus celidotus]
MDNVLDSGSQKGKEEDFKVVYSDFESNEEEHGQCVGDVTEDQGASVEVILPSFDETESSDDDHMDKKWFHHLKTGRRTSAKTLKSEGDEDFSCRSKQKEHKMTMSQLGSTSQSCPDPSSLHSTNSELSNDDCSLICHVCDKVFACQKNFEKHQQICADASKRQEDQDPQCSSSLAHHRKPNIVDKTSKSSPCETSHAVTQESKTFHIPQDQTCKRSDRVKQCSICSEIFSCSTDFMEHMKCHTEKNPFLCPDCGIDFESYEGCEKHRKGGCRASSQHVKGYLLNNDNKGNQESTLVPSETSQTSTTRDAPKDSKTRKPLLTCQKCGMRFTYCKSFEKHQMKCSEETSPRKTKKNNLIISGCDSFSADKISERHAEKNCTTIEETPSTVVFKSYEICEMQEDGKYRASNQHELGYSWSNENKRNQENTLVSSEICQTSTTADAPADSKGPKPPLTCQECGMCFICYMSFEKHRKKCAKATFQRKTNKNYVTINGCDFLLADGSNKSHVENSLETVEAIPSTEDFKSDDESEMHKEDSCRASNQYLEDNSMSNDNKRNQENTLVFSETSQTSTTGEAQHSKALKLPLTCQKCGLSFTYCKSFEKHQKKCSNAASQRKTKKNYFIISGCDFFLADDINESHDEKSSETVEINPSPADDVGGSQHKSRLFKCSMCEKDFSKIELLKRHYSESHDVRGPYPCTMCKRAFLTLYELVRHQQNKLLFLCPTCKKGFSNIGELKRHERIHTASASITPCTCETCGRSFKFRVNLIRHQRRHRERPPSVCSYCGKQFSSKDGLKAHMVRHTEGYPCPVCGKKFYQKAYLTYHLNRHTGQEKYLCDICGKGWPTVSLLKVHMVKHTEGQPFQCDDCGLTYKRKSGLLAHHRDKHLGLRPFVCEICSKAFRINSQLKKHMTVHTGERPFSCPICGKKFTKSFNLKKHREKPCK